LAGVQGAADHEQHTLQRMWSCWWSHVHSGRCATDTSVSAWNVKKYWNWLSVTSCMIFSQLPSTHPHPKKYSVPIWLIMYSQVVQQHS